ncbi:MAG: hypothetical protein ACF8LK_08370 [Phycisphaerales bacterium JB041]
MSERPSLIDDAGIPDPSNAKGGGSGRSGPDANTLKIVGAAAILVAALAVLGWGMGWFSAGPEADPDNEQRRQRLEQEVQEDAEIDAKTPVRRYESGG